jgi:protein phosphatase
VLSRSIGGEQHVRPDVAAVELGPGDQLVLASDGVADVLDGAGVAAAVSRAATAEEAAQALVVAALAAGTTDNVTTVVLRQVASSSA